jgi:hypothetical protein
MRRHPRAALDAAVQLTAADGQICRARTFDISEGGLGLLDVPAAWSVGSTVAVHLDASEIGRQVHGEGTIVARRGEKVGVQFTSLDAEAAPAIAAFVARGRERDEIDDAEAAARRR